MIKDEHRRNVKFRCDRCNREMTTEDRTGIYTVEQRGQCPKKRWDFCSRCFRLLVLGVENYSEEMVKRKKQRQELAELRKLRREKMG